MIYLKKNNKIVVYKEVLPLDAPPSFQGHSIKYFYKLEIATQRISSAIRKITIPFRVLPFETNLLQTAFYQSPSDEVLPSNPFLVETEKITPSDIALEEIQVGFIQLFYIFRQTVRRERKIFLKLSEIHYQPIVNKHVFGTNSAKIVIPIENVQFLILVFF